MLRARSSALSAPLGCSGAHRVLPLAVLLAVALPALAQGQVVRGRLVDADGERGIGGAMMTLLDRSGNEAEQILTRTASGLFELSAPDPGEYRRWLGESFTPGELWQKNLIGGRP